MDKYRYVFAKDDKHVFEYFDLEEIQAGCAQIKVDFMGDAGFVLISRDRFTGMKDKNEREVYHHDFLDCTSETVYAFRVGQPSTGNIKTTIYEVVWREDSWATKVIKSDLSIVGLISKGLKITAEYGVVCGTTHDPK